MPEFAEVHFQVRWLAQRVTGWTLKSYQCLSRSHLKNLDARARAGLDAFFQGARLQRVSQRGKLVVFELDRGTITTHLMFKGRWSLDSEVFISNYKAHSEPPTKGLGFEIEADQGKLIFHDIENRAKINIYANQRPDEIGELTDLGPEALVTPETASGFAQLDWHLDEWRAKIARSNKPIKAVLLDQKIVSGIGNVYSCEALYRARIHPARPAKSLSANETKAIYDSTRELLALMIRNGLDYENEKKIYKRDTDPDGRPVTTGDIAGRDSYWVESLQS